MVTLVKKKIYGIIIIEIYHRQSDCEYKISKIDGLVLKVKLFKAMVLSNCQEVD